MNFWQVLLVDETLMIFYILLQTEETLLMLEMTGSDEPDQVTIARSKEN